MSTQAHDEVRQLIERWQTAVRAKNLDAIMAYYAPDILAFDAIIQLQFKGKDAYREHWIYCNNMCSGPMLFDIDQLNIVANGDIAFAHWLTHCGGTAENGEEMRSWMRTTACYRKHNGQWQAVHEHFSSPFDMETGKALFDAQP